MMPTVSDVLASCYRQGFILGHPTYWWDDELAVATPLGILCREDGIKLANPGAAHDPVFAWCKQQFGHPFTEAVIRSYQGYPSRGYCCVTTEHWTQYRIGMWLGLSCRCLTGYVTCLSRERECDEYTNKSLRPSKIPPDNQRWRGNGQTRFIPGDDKSE